MKRFLLLLVVWWLGGLVVGSEASLVDINATYVSKYIWRGQDQNGGQPALQSAVTFYLGNSGFSLGLWGNCNIGGNYYGNSNPTGFAIGRQLTEVDYTLTYASAFSDSWNYSFYYSQYTYPPDQFIRTGELFLVLTGDGWPFKPALTLSYDNDQGKGSYVSLAGKNSFAAGPQKIDGSLTVGYDNGQFGVKPGFSDATLALSAALPGKDVTITPSLNYTVVGKDTRPTGENVIWFGLNIASGS
jgi:uncharacterized protein (TIGR02001 family)